MLENLLRAAGVYSVYEKWLTSQISKREIPRHIGVILDGNRRWASQRNMNPYLGHYAGADKVEQLIRWCGHLGVRILTLYVLSIENFARSEREVKALLNLLREEITRVRADEEVMRNRVRFKMIGGKELLPPDLLRDMEELERKTEGNSELVVNVAVAYGGKKEIVDATRKMAEDLVNGRLEPDEIDEDLFQQYLYTSHLEDPSVDLGIRTSGEKRLSWFLFWQSAYSELVFIDAYWPSFRKIDLMRAIRIYQHRHRRLGR